VTLQSVIVVIQPSQTKSLLVSLNNRNSVSGSLEA